MELKDFMKIFMPELWESACYWSALKYNIRAGKKEGESFEKDLGKRDDYIEEIVGDDSVNQSLIKKELDVIKENFEKWKV